MTSRDQNEIERKVAMIVGAYSPVGRAICLKCAKLGYNVAMVGKNDKETIAKLMSEMDENEDFGVPTDARMKRQRYLSIPVAFTNQDDHKLVINKFSEQFDRLDLLVNNYANSDDIPTSGIYDETFYQEFTSTMNTSLFVAYQMSQVCSEVLIQTSTTDEAVIINITSVNTAVSPIHSIASAGVIMLTKVLANAFENKRVRVVGVEPKTVASGPNSTSRKANQENVPHEIADFVVGFLGSPGSSFVNGTTIPVNVG